MSRPPDPAAAAAADPVEAAFAAQPRAAFLPPEQRPYADHDGPLPIGHGQTNSQPRTVAAMLRLLEVAPGQRVLDVGAGSGWTTALLAHLVSPSGAVHGVERVPELARFGAANLQATQQPWAQLVVATPGVYGLPALAPFDRILVSAEADRLPAELVEQLGEGGVMVIPVAGRMQRVRRRAGAVDVTEHGGYRFVPLLASASY